MIIKILAVIEIDETSTESEMSVEEAIYEVFDGKKCNIYQEKLEELLGK